MDPDRTADLVGHPAAQGRGRLWMAVEMHMLALEAPAPDALTVLRGHAYAAGRTADDVALDLVERRLQPDQLREDAGSDRCATVPLHDGAAACADVPILVAEARCDSRRGISARPG